MDGSAPSAAAGLLLRCGSRWHFADADSPLGDELLVRAAMWPLSASLPEELQNLFTESDEWQHRPQLDKLSAELTRGKGDACAESSLEACLESCALRTGRSGSAGRGLFSRAAATSGELLLRESAYAAALWPCAFTTHCHHCLCNITQGATFRCRGRGRHYCNEQYCSSECSDAAWSIGHSIECGTLMHAIAPRTVLMCVRALLRARAADGGAAADDLEALLGLRDHRVDMSSPRLSQLRFHARLYARAVPAHGALEETLAKLLRLALTNSFAVSELVTASTPDPPTYVQSHSSHSSCARVERLGRRTVGEALFAHAGVLNHACAPNANVRHAGRHVEIRAASSLTASEEVCISYGPQKGFDSVHTRQERTREVYHFTCACRTCEREAAPAAEPPRALRQRAQQLDERARAACERGDFRAAAELSRAALDLLKRVFPEGSPQVAHEEVKLAQLLFNARADATARAALEHAAACMVACYGTDDGEAKEMRRLATICAHA